MDKEQIKNISFYIMLVVVICICVYLIFYIRQETYKCIANPLVYSINRLSTQDNEVTCQCSTPGSSIILYATKYNVSVMDLNYNNFLNP